MLKSKKEKSKIFHYNFLEKNRKASHVGMILSFVVFITFLIFIFSILQPAFNEKKDKTTVLDYISSNIVELISGNFSVVTIEVNNTKGEDCFKIDGEAGIKKYGTVKNKMDEAQPTLSWPVPSLISVNPIDSQETIFKIYSSEEIIIPENFINLNCNNFLGPTNIKENYGYEIKSIRETEYPFLTKAIKLGLNISLTNETHKELGQKLKVPPGTEFSIQLINSTGSEILGKRLDLNTEIYTREVSIEYVDLNGNVRQGKIRINVA